MLLTHFERHDENLEPIVESQQLDELDGSDEEDAADEVAVKLVNYSNVSGYIDIILIIL